MMNATGVLDLIGRNPALRYASADELLAALAQSNVEPELSRALMKGDREGLEDLLGARSNICCAIHAPEENEPDDPRSHLSS